MRPRIIAHRGASYLAPENTLAAFRLAKELGADGIEFDVQQTADGKLLIHHDYIIDFHTQLTGNIYDMLEGDLRELDFGSWKNVDFSSEKIPTLDEALAVGGELGSIMVELKSNVYPNESFVPDVLEKIRASGYADKVMLIAFQHDLLAKAKKLMPELKVGALLYGSLGGFFVPPLVMWQDLGLTNGPDSDEPNELLAALSGPQALGTALDIYEHPEKYAEENGYLLRWVDNQITMLRASFPGQGLFEIIGSLAAQWDPVAYVKNMSFKPDYVSCEYHAAYLQPGMVADLHALGVNVAFWTVDNRQALRSLLPLGPDAIVTDRPELVREAMDGQS